MQNDGHQNFQVLEERYKQHHEMLDEHERRLNDHEKRIRKEETHSGVMDESMKNLCKRMDGLTKAIWAFVAAIGAAGLGMIVDFIKSRF